MCFCSFKKKEQLLSKLLLSPSMLPFFLIFIFLFVYFGADSVLQCHCSVSWRWRWKAMCFFILNFKGINYLSFLFSFLSPPVLTALYKTVWKIYIFHYLKCNRTYLLTFYINYFKLNQMFLLVTNVTLVTKHHKTSHKTSHTSHKTSNVFTSQMFLLVSESVPLIVQIGVLFKLNLLLSLTAMLICGVLPSWFFLVLPISLHV